MQKTLNFTITLVGVVSAIKQEGISSQSEANMGQTKSEFSYEVENLGDIQSQIETWYSKTGNPFITEHRDKVWGAAWAEAEEKYGKLLETCDEGTKCREELIKDLK